MSTILLTGATGYLGGHLSDFFLAKGYKIIALCLNKNEKFNFKEELRASVKEYFLDETSLKEIFEENNIDIVIHTATLYGRNNETLEQMLGTNELFPLEVLSLAAEKGVKLFINTDTILPKYISNYALTKNHFYDWLVMFSGKLKCVNMKLDHFYGANDKPIKFIAWLISQLRQNVGSIKLTEGSQKRDFIYIDDVVSAYDCIISNQDKIFLNKVNTFEVGTNDKVSIKKLVLLLKDLMENEATRFDFGAIPYRKNEVLDYDVDTAALRSLGWEPKIFIKEGLTRVLEIEAKDSQKVL